MRVENARKVAPADLEAVKQPGYRARVERVVYIDVVTYDWNCPQHITPRYSKAEIKALASAS